jgi:hypothetical protein
MPGDENQAGTREFDLSSLIAQTSHGAWVSNAIIGFAITSGFAVACVGVFEGFVQSAGTRPLDPAEAAIVILTGLSVILASVWSLSTTRHAPDRLAVSDDALKLADSRGSRSLTVKWSDSRLSLTLADRSGLRRPDAGGRSAFVLYVGGRRRVPVPRAGFEAILNEANRHGLRLNRRVYPGIAKEGKVELIEITSASR